MIQEPSHPDRRTEKAQPRGRSVAFALVLFAVGPVAVVAVGCAATSSEVTAAKSTPASDVQAGAPAQGVPSPGVPSPDLRPTSAAPRTIDEAVLDVAKADKELSDALDPTKAIPLSTDRCSVVCQALTSMRNATGNLCGLTSDNRCDDAKARLAKAETKAKEACPLCAAQ